MNDSTSINEGPDLKAVLCLNGLAEGQLFVVDVRQPTFDLMTIYGVEVYQIGPSSIGPEGYVATCDTSRMPRRR